MSESRFSDTTVMRPLLQRLRAVQRLTTAAVQRASQDAQRSLIVKDVGI